MRVRRIVAVGGLVLLLCWVGVCLALLAARHSLIYPFRDWVDARQVNGLPGAVAETMVAGDGTEIIVWRVEPRTGRPTVFYFMGNAGSLPSTAPRLAELAMRGYGIVALNYRGAGGAAGEPREVTMTADAVTIWDRYAEPERPPVIYGTSLGAAVATQLAARRPAAALILETPFARLCETAEHHYPYVPACLILPDEHWDSAEAIRRVDAPVLILHGDADRTIPLAHGRRLFEAAREPKEMKIYPGGQHNDLRLHGAGADVMAFIEAHVP